MSTILELDGMEQAVSEDIADLEHLLYYAMKQGSRKNQMIVEVSVDEGPFSETYPNEARDIPLSDIDRVSVRTQPAAEFARSSLRQLPSILNGLQAGFRRSGELLRAPDTEAQGHALLATSLETLAEVKTHLAGIRGVLGDHATGSGPAAFWARFDGLAGKILDAQEEMDAERIADLMKEDLLPLFAQWQSEPVDER